MNLNEIVYYMKNYAHPGVSDQRACDNFLECETAEKVNPLKAQLNTVARGGIDDDYLHKIIGKGRQMKHGSYKNWALLMLQWLNIRKS